MVNGLRVQNKKTKQMLVFDDEETLLLDSVNWGTPNISFNRYSVPFQIGSFHTGAVVREREIVLSGYIIADVFLTSMIGVTWEEYYKKQLEQIEAQKAVINRFFSIYQELDIFVGDYKITGYPESPVKYSYKTEENNDVLCYFEVTILCHNPMFYKGSRRVELSSMIDMFHFPLIIPQDEGVIFGEVFPRTAALVVNDGDVPVGCTITMTAHGGGVSDPKIINVNTNRFIGFENVTLNSNEYIVINTTKGEESAVKHTASREISLIGKLIEGSEFLQISVGSEYYFYDMDGSEQNLATTIEYSENVFNFERM